MRKLRSWKLLLPLAALAAVPRSGRPARSPRRRQHVIRVAIMTDCKGAFAFGYEMDIAARRRPSPQYAGGRPKNKNKPSAGMRGIAGRRQASRSSATAAATTRPAPRSRRRGG